MTGAPVRTVEVTGIQYLRGVAALMVVIYHLSWQVRAMSGGVPLINLRAGVDIFFVISGFVMMYSTGAGRKYGAWMFLKRRLVRIVPLYWAVTLFMVAVLLIAPKLVQSATLVPAHAAASFAFLPALSPAMPTEYRPLVIPGWTLNLEMGFYALFALGIWLGRGSARGLLVALAIPILLLAGLGLSRSVGGAPGFYCDPVILEFLMGAILGYVRLRGRADPPRIAWLLAGLAFVLMVVPPAGDILYRPFRAGLPALVIVWAGTSRGIPGWRALHLIGDSSYSLYLSHFFVVSLMTQLWKRLHLLHLPGSTPLFYLCSTVLAVLVGLIVWRVLEMPLTRFVQRVVIGTPAKASVSLRS